jgi:hypothetical protein
MINFNTLINGQNIKHEPELWFERFVVYRDINDAPIQSIYFRKGLNVIRAGDDSIQDEITGHGTGKTTICRFLRYLLGEPTFSNKHDRKLIEKIFEKGCIAAELYVRGKKKTVRRSFDDSTSYILDIILSPPKSISKNQYIERLNLNSFCEHLNFRGDKSVQWDIYLHGSHVIKKLVLPMYINGVNRKVSLVHLLFQILNPIHYF